MKQFLGAAALAAAAGLALPAIAAAHPSVYTTTANVIKAGTTDQIESQTRYVVTNHGFTAVLRETNKLNATSATAAQKQAGVIGYNLIPGGWRAGKAFADVMAVGGTGVQVHATCLSPALSTEAVIKSWQGTDAFYNYIPFQAASAGFEDDPATWLPKLTAASFDVTKLGNAASAKAECEKVAGNEYVAADTIQTTIAALAAGPVAEAVKPLNEELTTLKAANETLTTEVADLKKTVFATNPLQSQVTTLTAQLTTANTEITTLKAAATPLKLTLSKVATSGITAALTGAPSSKVAITVSLTAAQANKAGLKSTTVATQNVTLAANGTGTATLTLSAKTKKALKSFKGQVTAQAVSADRFVTAKGKFGS